MEEVYSDSRDTLRHLRDQDGYHQNVDQAGAEPEYLSECSRRDKPWDTHRAQAEAVASIYGSQEEFQAYHGRMSLCSLSLGFAWAKDRLDPQAQTLKLREARFCRVRHCPVCQWRRTLLLTARFMTAVPKVLQEYPAARFVFLTLTRKNVAIGELRPTISLMNKAWQRMAQRQRFENAVLGWIRTTEVTRGADNTAHPHFHVLLLVPSTYFTTCLYLDHSAWRKLWRDALRSDYDPQVSVEKVKGDPMSAARETLKYSVKPNDMIADPNWFLDLTRQVRGLHFVASGGILNGVLGAEEVSEDDLLLRGEDGDNEHAQVFFDWWRHEFRYKREKILS